MKQMLIDRLAWVDKFDIPSATLSGLKADLTIEIPKFDGGVDTVTFYEDEPTRIGLPRVYGYKQAASLGITEVKWDYVIPFPISAWPTIKFPVGWSYWKGQESAIIACYTAFKNGELGGLLEAPCGSGKTLMAIEIAARLNTPALVLAHKTDLLQQWKDTVHGSDDGKRPELYPNCLSGWVQGDRLDYKNKHIVFGTFQSVYSRLEKLPMDFFRNFGIIIIDEGHRVPARTFEMVVRQFYAKHRLCVSATFRRKDNIECVWHWGIGRTIQRVDSVKLTGRYVQVERPFKLFQKEYAPWGKIIHSRLISKISEDSLRNQWLIEEFVKACEMGRKIAVLSDRREHCDLLKSMTLTRVAEKGKPISVSIYVGGMTKDQRDAAEKADCIIGTYAMFSEGTDIKQLDTLFLVTPRADIEQAVGRIQRPAEKRSLLIVDVVDEMQYCQRLANKRVRVYQDLGFEKA